MLRNVRKPIFFVLCLAILLFDIFLCHFLLHPVQTKKDVRISGIYKELCFFPVCKNQDVSFPWVSYVDSWAFARTYGGERRHEGCDVMGDENRRGIYPVISMTDGQIEKIGWLKLGGWRIGIRSESGTYYYYAHLESYSDSLEEGMYITAGTFLGFMGDSGYGSTGTTGQFDVHLHVGIYQPDISGRDVAMNPYPYLKYLEEKKKYLKASYTLP